MAGSCCQRNPDEKGLVAGPGPQKDPQEDGPVVGPGCQSSTQNEVPVQDIRIVWWQVHDIRGKNRKRVWWQVQNARESKISEGPSGGGGLVVGSRCQRNPQENGLVAGPGHHRWVWQQVQMSERFSGGGFSSRSKRAEGPLGGRYGYRSWTSEVPLGRGRQSRINVVDVAPFIAS